MRHNLVFAEGHTHVICPVSNRQTQFRLHNIIITTQLVFMPNPNCGKPYYSPQDRGRVYYRALVHFVHLLWVLSAFTLSDPAELSALKVPGWRTRNGKNMKWKTMVTKRAPSWLRSGRGGALLAVFHKKSTFILAGLVSRVDLPPSLPPCG